MLDADKRVGKIWNLFDCKIYIPLIVLLYFAVILTCNLFTTLYAIEPSIRESVKDAPFDWINIQKQVTSTSGDPSTDIVEVTYFTSDSNLNSTLWLLFPFRERPVNHSIFNYGILIDSDFDEDTGADGIDYQLEIKWDNQTNTWTRSLTEWSSYAIGGRVIEETKNFTGFSHSGLYYVSLPISLQDILDPAKLRAIYYAESQKHGGTLVTDFTKWVNVPSPEIGLTTSPESVKLRQGASKTIELLINSSSELQPNITLSTRNERLGPLLDFSNENFEIPSGGFASIPMTVKTTSETEVAPHTVPIYANSTFPSLEFVELNSSSSQALQFPFEIQGEDKVVKSSILIEVEPSATVPDQISEIWNKLGGPLTFLYGVIAGLSPIIFRTIRKKMK